MIATHIARETIIEVGGKKYKLSRFTRRLLREYLEWADKQLGHPLDNIKDRLKDFPPSIQEIMVKDALERSRFRHSFQSPEVQDLLNTVEGAQKLLCLLFKQYHPDLTEADIERLYEEATAEHGYLYIEKKLAEAQGQLPKEASQAEREALVEMGALPADPEKKG